MARKKHVLLVEGSDDDARLLRARLQQEDPSCRVTHVATFQEALTLLAHGGCDLVLVDLGPPDTVGSGGAEALRRVAPDVPVVALAEADDLRLADRARELGAREVLPKERLDHAPLADTLRSALAEERGAPDLRAVLRTLPVGLVVVDAERRVLFANAGARRLLGSGVAEGVVLPHDAPEGRASEVELREEGRPVVAELESSPVDWDGRPARLVVVRDVSDRKELEQLRRRVVHDDRLRALGQLAAGVAHEINNPAAFVLTNLEVLREELERLERMFDGAAPPPIAVRAFAAEMGATVGETLEGVERIRSIVGDLRTFSRFDGRRIEMVDLNGVVDAACQLVRHEIRHKGELVRDHGSVPLFPGDRARLVQVATNLVMNAVQALPASREGNRVRVATESANGRVLLIVEDNGEGIPEAVRERIFEPFFTTKNRQEGTGLGLSLSAEIVRQHRGELRLARTSSTGTRFEVLLPIDNGLRAAAQRSRSTSAPIAEARVLVVDDEPYLLRAYRRMLTGRCEAVFAEGGREGLEILRRDRAFDAILCDLVMSDLDGPGLFDQVASFAPEILPRFIFVTGGAFDGPAQSFTESLENPVLTKPVSSRRLLETIAQVRG